MKQLRSFLRESYSPKSYIYYNNPASIKIQLPTKNEQPLIDYLNDNNITYTIEHPKYIVTNFCFVPNCTTIRIKK